MRALHRTLYRGSLVVLAIIVIGMNGLFTLGIIQL